MPVDRRVRRQVFGQVFPVAAIFKLIKDAINQVSLCPVWGSRSLLGRYISINSGSSTSHSESVKLLEYGIVTALEDDDDFTSFQQKMSNRFYTKTKKLKSGMNATYPRVEGERDSNNSEK